MAIKEFKEIIKSITPSGVFRYIVTFLCGALASITLIYGHFESPIIGRIAAIMACLALALLPHIVVYHKKKWEENRRLEGPWQ